ncbi:MAG TPA: MBL fold metallo-hydrolase [Solirubrobacteraceae bacterium]|jgi:glyoxylase-like metal-dependent hydrolase (beta-lactamase superfamily II)|nr:MBL fold metallo-hydrolase [Solirubrobacteraceae bacterium]
MEEIEVPGHDVLGIRADNPSPFTLTGTNSWIVGRGPAWVVDPGPALAAHAHALAGELERRGGLGGIALTHDHLDHSEGAPALSERFGRAPVAGSRGAVDVVLAPGGHFGPFEVLATPGHAPDHLAFVHDRVAFTGDAVLGEGSVFIAPDPGALSGYLEGLRRLRALDLELICPAHGPLVRDPAARIDAYLAHRAEREARLVAALTAGKRGVDELLDAAWSDAPAALRPAAAITLAAHLDKLADEGRLPAGVERPAGWPLS